MNVIKNLDGPSVLLKSKSYFFLADFMKIVIELSNIAMRTIIRRLSTSKNSSEAKALNFIQTGMIIEATESLYNYTRQILG